MSNKQKPSETVEHVLLPKVLQEPDTIVLQKIATFIADSEAICEQVDGKLVAWEASFCSEKPYFSLSSVFVDADHKEPCARNEECE